MSIRYQQSRARSGEILRLAIGLMGRQKAGFHPVSYAVWYEHVSGVNPALSQALDERLASGDDLNDEDIERLHVQYIAARDGDTVERIKQHLLTLLQETSEAVSSTGSHAVQFSETLAGQSRRLDEPASLDLIREVVKEIMTETHHMRTANVTLSQQLQTSMQEVQALTTRLDEVQAQCLRDPLTGLLNRRGFENAVAELHASGDGLSGASLLVADVDLFKQVNDAHGHLLGDKVLCVVAEVLRARTKGSDIATRLGGDEFAVLLPATPLDGAMALAEQTRAALARRRWTRSDRKVLLENITVTIGIAHANIAEKLEDVLQRADLALYTGKRAGRDRVQCALAAG